MSYVSIKKKINILIMGIIFSIFFSLMLYVLFAQILSDFVIGNVEDNTTLFAIIIGLLLIMIITSMGVSFLIVKEITKMAIFKTSMLSLLILILFLIVISYVPLMILEPQVFSLVEGVEIIWVFPSILVYFGVYILKNVFMLFIMSIVFYFIVFIVFIEVFYIYKIPKYKRKSVSKW